MPAYLGPTTDWKAKQQQALANVMPLVNTANSLQHNIEPLVDPQYDYLAKAEEYAFAAANNRRRLVDQLVKNSTIRAANSLGGQSPGNGFRGFVRAIRSQESGGNYGAVNPDSGALGAYQIMPGNIQGSGSGWDYEALGRDVSPTQFLNHRHLQNLIAKYKLQQYFGKYGAAGAASAWYSGDPGLWNDRSPQGTYPSIHQYVVDILRAMGRR